MPFNSKTKIPQLDIEVINVMKKSLLFCGFDINKSNSSSAIRNRKLISQLNLIYNVEIFNIISLKSKEQRGSYLDLGSNLDEDPNNEIDNKNKLNSIRVNFIKPIFKLIRPIFKAIVPDRFIINVLTKKIAINENEVNKIDIVLTSSDPKSAHLIILNKYFKKTYINKDVKVIQYWGDPWYDDVNINSNYFTSLFESWIIKRSDIVLYNTIGTLAKQKKRFPLHSHKMHHLGRGIDPVVKMLPDRKTYELQDAINFLYAGDYSISSRNINNLVKSISESSCRLTIIGNGSISESINDNITLIPRMSPEAINEHISHADVLIVLMNYGGSQIPGKLFDYMSEDKPVLVLFENEVPFELKQFEQRLIFVRNDCISIEMFVNNLMESRKIEVEFLSLKKLSFADEMDEIIKLLN